MTPPKNAQGPTKWAVPVPAFRPTEGLQPRINHQQQIANGLSNASANFKTPVVVSRLCKQSINYQNYEDDQEDEPTSLTEINEHYLYDRKKVVCSILMAMAIIMLIIGTALLIKSNHNEDKWKARCEKEKKVDNVTRSLLMSKYDCENIKSYRRLFSTYIFLWEPILLIGVSMLFYATVELRENPSRFVIMQKVLLLSLTGVTTAAWVTAMMANGMRLVGKVLYETASGVLATLYVMESASYIHIITLILMEIAIVVSKNIIINFINRVDLI
ncbi:DgyrCDS9082 [Dimorphilus gyrociliatus]|uniref:DgyrCDS9082 n=1 Tax=Dimorphilus gyrociliatus TaxID=2664684 RepID=A0A7I8VXS4_9ANNE|nr:DgyrCDS9082 [Dimorphilus gyrociliatus]